MNEGKKSTSRIAYGILNAYGDLWTPVTWATSDGAARYLQNVREEFAADGNEKAMLQHRVVRVRVTYRRPSN